MRRLFLIFGLLLCAANAGAQTTTFNGVVKDLTNTPVPTGQVTFQLKPGIDTTISGSSRFVPATTFCEIHNPGVVSTSGTGTITVVVDTAQTWLVGDSLIFVGTGDATLNASSVATPYVITTRNSSTSFVFTQAGAHVNGAGGTVGGLYASGGTGGCKVMQNSALLPQNTSYTVSIQAIFSPSSSFNTYAIGSGPVDISTVVPTPSQMPSYSFMDLFSNQTIAGNKTFTGSTTISSYAGAGTHNGIETFLGLIQCKNFESVFCVDSANSGGWTGIDGGAWSNSAYSALPSNGGGTLLAPAVYNFTTTINFGVNGKTNYFRCLAPSAVFGGSTGSTVLNYTGSGTAWTVASGAGGGIDGCQLTGPSSAGATLGLNPTFAVKQVFRDLDISGFGTGIKFPTGANTNYLNNYYNLQLHDNGQNFLFTTGGGGTENQNIFGCTIHNAGAAFSATSIDFGTGADFHWFGCSHDQAGITFRGTTPMLADFGGHGEDPNGSTSTAFVTFDTSCAACTYVSVGKKWTEDFNSGRTAIIQANGAAGGNIISVGDLIHSAVNPLANFIALGASNMTATVIGAQSDGATITNWCSGGTACLVLLPTLSQQTILGTSIWKATSAGIAFGAGAPFTTSGNGGTPATIAGAETLTSKTLTSPTITSPTINTGIAANGSGFKHIRTTAGCVTAAVVGATCDTTVPWTTGFADGSYTPGCNGFGITSGVPANGGIVSISGASAVFRTVAITAVAAQFTSIACMAGHD